MKDELPEEKALARVEEDRDLRERTKGFALRVVKMYSALPKNWEPLFQWPLLNKAAPCFSLDFLEVDNLAPVKPNGNKGSGNACTTGQAPTAFSISSEMPPSVA